ncbi:monocarboxylate transporter 12-like [Centruroides sculpturatus]|uniref:monocarboxylate transporter 12-like n=1 Tax=Centruroides sculpturatus TaxID=218467 RepID=UPI000C6CF9F5|nr:monocarboxylate transporter 12-like [Centruroides sculpturatus]
MTNIASKKKKWNWLVALACFCTMFTTIGVLRISGVLYTSITHVYSVSRENAAWPFYVRRSVGLFTTLSSGFLMQYFDIRTQVFAGILLCSLGLGLCYLAEEVLFITLSFGIMYGIGSGVVRTSNVIIINRYFSQYRTIATGLILSGTSLGSFVFPPFADFLIHFYGLRGSFLLISGILLQGLIATSLYKTTTVPRRKKSLDVPKNLTTLEEDCKSHQSKTADNVREIEIRTIFEPKLINSNEEESISNKQNSLKEKSNTNKFCLALMSYLHIFKFPMFYVISVTSIIAKISFYTFINTIIDFAIDCGNSRHNSIFLLSASSISEVIGRLGCGFFIDLKVLKRQTVIQISFVSLASIFAIIPIWNSYGMLITATILIGIFASCLIVNSSVLYTEYLGIENLPYAYGIETTLSGLIGFLLPLFIGYCRDVIGSYNLLFYVFGSQHLFAAILWSKELVKRSLLLCKCQ